MKTLLLKSGFMTFATMIFYEILAYVDPVGNNEICFWIGYMAGMTAAIVNMIIDIINEKR